MLDDNRIRYIIPYHASSLPAEIKVATHIELGTDYTPYQNNMKISEIVDHNGNKVNWTIKEAYKRLGSGQAVLNELNEKIRNEGWVVKTTKAQNGHGSYGLYEDLQQTNDPRQTASNFMDWCIKNSTLPLFYQFSSHENYYKLLYDFNVYDCVTEEYAPQQAVTNTYPTMVDGQVQPGNVIDGGFDAEYFKGTIDKQMAFMDEYSRNLDEDLDSLADNMEKGIQFSDRDIRQDPLYPDTRREQSAFNRSFMNKISGLKRNKERDIIINTHLYTYHVLAVGGSYKGNPYRGEILKKIPIDNAVNVHDVQEEITNGTYRATEADYIPYEETQYDRRRNDSRTPSLRERLAAEGYDYLLDEPYEGDTEGGRGQGGRNRQSNKVKLSDRVTDQETLDFLNEQLRNGEVTEVYRAMAVDDAQNLYPPMAGFVRKNGKKVINGHPSVIGEWEQSTESIPWEYVDEEFLIGEGFKHFEKPTKDYPNGRFERENTIFYRNKDGEWKAKFHLDKDNGSTVDAAYAPYIHTSLSVLNDQFTSAYTRDNLVVVRGYVPNSEINGVNGNRYQANFADKPVGKTKWHSGVVAAQMPETRTVILSRYFMPIEIVDDAEFAQKTKDMMKGAPLCLFAMYIVRRLTNWQAHAKMSSTASSVFGRAHRKHLSADYVGYARKHLEEMTGASVIYFTGGAGNLNPDSRIKEETPTIFPDEYGKQLADFAVKGLVGMRRVSGGKVSTRQRIITAMIDHSEDHKVAECQEIWDIWTQDTEACQKLARERGYNSAFATRDVIARSKMGESRTMEIDTVAVGDIAFTTAPYEMFCDNAKYIKENSPFEKTIVISCSNGANSYLASDFAFTHGGYEVDSRKFVRGTAEMIVQNHVQMLREQKENP